MLNRFLDNCCLNHNQNILPDFDSCRDIIHHAWTQSLLHYIESHLHVGSLYYDIHFVTCRLLAKLKCEHTTVEILALHEFVSVVD